MKNKILYIEDQNPSSIKNSLEREGFKVSTCEASNFDMTLTAIEQNPDIFLMDYKLTEGKGRVDAPTFAATIRSRNISAPIILITNEPNLAIFENDFTNHDTFDLVLSKTKFRDNIERYAGIIKDLVNAYSEIKSKNFDIDNILGNPHVEIDFRLKEKLNQFALANDTYMLCRTIYHSMIRSCGLLVGEDLLAARLGIDINSGDFFKLLEELRDCRYTGILSESYNRWWFSKVLEEWANISGNKSLRRMSAIERVTTINKQYKLELVSASPIELAQSTNFWTICSQLKLPLDPSEGYVLNHKEVDVWQECEYISLKGVLDYPENNIFLTPADKKEVLTFKG